MYTVSRVGNTIDGTIDTIERIKILKTSMVCCNFWYLDLLDLFLLCKF